jgi:subtilisin family serine protease
LTSRIILVWLKYWMRYWFVITYLSLIVLKSSDVSAKAPHANITTLHFKNSKVETQEIARLLEEWAVPIAILPARPSYYIVQYSAASFEVRNDLERISEIVRYIPDRGYIIHLLGSLSDLEQISGIEWFGEYHPYLRVEGGLLSDSKNGELELEIALFPRSETEKVIDQLKSIAEVSVLDISAEMIKVRAKRSEVPKLALVNGVEWIQKAKEPSLVDGIKIADDVSLADSTLTGSDDFERFEGFASGAKALNPDRLYERGIRGSSELIAVADSGLDQGKMEEIPRDLSGRIRNVQSLGRSATQEWDDPLGHGTHVTGLLAGNGAASEGRVRGVAYEAEITFQSLFRWRNIDGERVKGIALPSSLGRLFERPYQEGARVHTNSWQLSGFSNYGIQESGLDSFVWKYPDMVIVFAVGNNGVDLNGDGWIDERSLSIPSDAKNCIAVGASENLILRGGIQRPWGMLGMLGARRNIWGANPIKSDIPSNNLNGIAAFSGRGPTADGRIKPDLVAPGTNNLSLRSHARDADPKESWGIFNDDYLFNGGTSMAAPLVAGAAALVRQYYRTVEKREVVSSALVKAALINGSVDLYPGQFGNFDEIPTIRPNIHEGWGRVNLASFFSQGGVHSVDDLKGLKEGEFKEFVISIVDQTSPLRVTLVYNDYPASPSASRILVNDLDLSVRNSRNAVYFPNRKKGRDHLNNVEHIDIEEPMLGDYRIRIDASSVPLGDEFGRQPYAVVFSPISNGMKVKEREFF